MVKTKVTVAITMGQAFRYDLPRAVKALGGRVWEVDTSDPTDVRVTATLPMATPSDVQEALWVSWPMCWIDVRKA